MDILQASLHQGHLSFKGRGKQCMANSVCAIRRSYIVDPESWTRSTLDGIMLEGDRLYLDLAKTGIDYLSVDDIPQHYGEMSAPLQGLLLSTFTDPPFYSLEDAVTKLTSDLDAAGCILTLGETEPCYSSALLKNSNSFYFFDPHSRNESGMLSPNGKATLTKHKNVNALCLFIRHLASSLHLKNVPFEAAQLSSNQPASYDQNHSSSEFSGFDTVSDGEYACKMYIAENTEVSSVSSVSSCSSLDDSGDESSLTTQTSETFDGLKSIDTNSCRVDDQNAKNDSGSDPGYIGDTDDNDDDAEVAYFDKESVNDDVDDVDDDDVVDDDDDDDDLDDDPDYKVDDNDEDDDDDDDEDDNLPLIKLKKKLHEPFDIQCSFIESIANGNKIGASRKKRARDEDVTAQQVRNCSVTETTPDETGDRNRTSQQVRPDETPDKDRGRKRARYEDATVTAQNEIQDKDVETELDETPVRGRGRKRVRDETKWTRRRAKQRRNEGKSYMSLGKLRGARKMNPGCGLSCRCKCKGTFCDNDREHIFHSFWQLGDINRQRNFLAKYALQTPKKSKRKNVAHNTHRSFSVSWTLPHPEDHTAPVKVCKTFFLHTLGISETVVATAHRKLTHIGICDPDHRGSHTHRPNRIPDVNLNNVRKHIESFQCLDSHYCRKDTTKQYLPGDLNVCKMHRLYEAKCIEESLVPVSLKMYRTVFDNEYNISFHKPLKDRCDYCVSHENASPAEKANNSQEYQRHIQNKIKSRKNKETDKCRAKIEQDLAVACFDLEEVLLTPHSNESCLYYKRRLSTFNFTIYDFGSKDGHCYVWNEAIAGRGACEIASCVYDFIEKKVSQGKKRFIFYSDNCSAQNKNKFYMTMLWFCLNKFQIKSIEHKYLIKGHTQNEADSIHAAVEVCARKISIYTTPQWAATIRSARSKYPYFVKEMAFHDFFDYKSLSSNIKNFNINTEGEKVNWLGCKTLAMSFTSPNIFEYQSDYDGLVKSVDLLKNFRKQNVNVQKHLTPVTLRHDGIPIKKDKYFDLLWLCKKGIIPRVHHVFFLLLPHET